MGLIIVCEIVGVLAIVAGIIIHLRLDDGFQYIGYALGALLITVTTMIAITVSLSYKQEINTFKKQKEYIEQVAPTLPTTDNYAITNKRIELNQWLYEVQYRYEHHRFITLAPQEVMELEPIK